MHRSLNTQTNKSVVVVHRSSNKNNNNSNNHNAICRARHCSGMLGCGMYSCYRIVHLIVAVV